MRLPLTCLILSGLLISAAPGQEQRMNLNNLTKEQYTEFVREMYKEWKQDPQAAGWKARTVLIGMLGLEKKPTSHIIFETNINYTINTLLLVVANANKIQRGADFIAEYNDQYRETRKMLTSETDKTLLDVMTNLFLKEQENLKPKKWWQR